MPLSVQSRGGLVDGSSTPLDSRDTAHEDPFPEALRSAACANFTENRGVGSERHTSGNDHPGRIEPSIIDPKIQELGSAIYETVIFLIHVAR